MTHEETLRLAVALCRKLAPNPRTAVPAPSTDPAYEALVAAEVKRRELYAGLLRGTVDVKEYVAAVMAEVDSVFARAEFAC